MFSGDKWPKMKNLWLGNDKIIEPIIYLIGMACAILATGCV